MSEPFFSYLLVKKMAMNLASLIPLSLHPLSVVSKDLAVGGQKIGRRWPTRLLHWAVLTDKLVCYNDAGCLQPGKCLCKCSSGKKKKIPRKAAAVWGALCCVIDTQECV